MKQPPLLSDEVFERAEVDALAANDWRLDEETCQAGRQGLRDARNVLARTRRDADDHAEVAA